MEKETRVFKLDTIEVRQDEGEPPTIRGYAALYDEPSEDLGGFVEVIERGALSKAVGRDDVRALFNHDANYVLGRNRSGTLELVDDERGLQVNITPPPTQWATDLMTSMRRGDVDQMSFAFSVMDEEWGSKDDKPQRTLKSVKLYDVSVVTYPAYPTTSAAVRSHVQEMNDVQADDNQPTAEAASTQARNAARKRQLELLRIKQ
jgi:HK97 family phage prohead protease